jgi:hypothetical protein
LSLTPERIHSYASCILFLFPTASHVLCLQFLSFCCSVFLLFDFIYFIECLFRSCFLSDEIHQDAGGGSATAPPLEEVQEEEEEQAGEQGEAEATEAKPDDSGNPCPPSMNSKDADLLTAIAAAGGLDVQGTSKTTQSASTEEKDSEGATTSSSSTSSCSASVSSQTRDSTPSVTFSPSASTKSD